MTIRPLIPSDLPQWRRMRLALWPEFEPDQINLEIADYQAHQRIAGQPGAVFVYQRDDGNDRLGGFIELSLRPFADACRTSPVAYIEGWYVDPDLRRGGIGRALFEAAKQWARHQNCAEIASDCNANNTVSYQAHQRLGFAPTNRLILFRKPLAQEVAPARQDWIAIVSHELWVGTALKLVNDAHAGGIDIFLGTTRAQTSPDGRELIALDYEAYPEMALEQLQQLAKRAREKWPIIRLALLHRVGRVPLSEPSVIIAVASAHRAGAFEACRFLIDELKRDVAIWKKEIWSDGSQQWVHP